MGNLNNIVVGGKISFSSLVDNLSFVDAERKKSPYCCHQQGLIGNTKFILTHFQEPLFLRTISTVRTKGKQITLHSINQIIVEFTKSNFIDCRINAFSSIKSQTKA
jgi:hypothetical protein